MLGMASPLRREGGQGGHKRTPLSSSKHTPSKSQRNCSERHQLRFSSPLLEGEVGQLLAAGATFGAPPCEWAQRALVGDGLGLGQQERWAGGWLDHGCTGSRTWEQFA